MGFGTDQWDELEVLARGLGKQDSGEVGIGFEFFEE
jgi:hypothetical protein